VQLQQDESWREKKLLRYDALDLDLFTMMNNEDFCGCGGAKSNPSAIALTIPWDASEFSDASD
jgi:hypothetical protein